MLCHLFSLLVLPQIIDPPPRVERLENGLRVAIVEEHALPLVSVQLWYRAGSAGDAIEQPGLCHVARTILEHRDDAALKLRAAGVRFESRTLRDACYFSSVLPPNFLEYVLGIEAARMRPLAVTAEIVADGLAAAARDYGLNPDEPEQLAERELLAAMFPGHPYQHPPGFVAETLKNLKPADVQESLDRWFVPGNATLFIIGDVSTPAALELVRKHFSSLPWREPPRRAESRLPEPGTVHISTAGPDRTGIDIAWLTPPAGYFENAAFDVLMHRLCNPVDGPLCKRLLGAGCPPLRWRREAWRHAGLLVLSIDLPALGATGGLSTRASLEPGDLQEIVREELAKAAETIPTEIEHNRARALAMRDVRNRRAAFGDRARILAAHEIIAGDLLIAGFTLPRLEHVAVADVQQAALALQAARTVVRETGRRPTVARESSSTPVPRAVHSRPLPADPPTRLSPDAALELLETIGAELPDVGQVAPPSCTTFHTQPPSPLTLTVIRVPGMSQVVVRTQVLVGRYPTVVMRALLAAGSVQHTHAQLADYLSYHGIELVPAETGLAATGPPERADAMIEIHAELLRHPNLDPTTLAAALAAARARKPPSSPGACADDLAQEISELGFAALDVSGLRQLLGGLVREPYGRFTHPVYVHVVGNVDPDQVRKTGERVWSRRASARQPTIPDDDERAPGRSVRLSRKERPPISWVPGESDSVEIRIVTHVGPLAHIEGQTLWYGGIEQDLISTLLAAPPRLGTPDLDGRQTWLWRSRVTPQANLILGTRTDAAAAPAAIEGVLSRIRDAFSARAERPPGLDAALRLARVARLTSLCDPNVIADVAMAAGTPWDLELDPPPEKGIDETVLPPLTPQTRIVVVGGDDRLRGQLERFGRVRQIGDVP